MIAIRTRLGGCRGRLPPRVDKVSCTAYRHVWNEMLCILYDVSCWIATMTNLKSALSKTVIEVNLQF